MHLVFWPTLIQLNLGLHVNSRQLRSVQTLFVSGPPVSHILDTPPLWPEHYKKNLRCDRESNQSTSSILKYTSFRIAVYREYSSKVY